MLDGDALLERYRGLCRRRVPAHRPSLASNGPSSSRSNWTSIQTSRWGPCLADALGMILVRAPLPSNRSCSWPSHDPALWAPNLAKRYLSSGMACGRLSCMRARLCLLDPASPLSWHPSWCWCQTYWKKGIQISISYINSHRSIWIL